MYQHVDYGARLKENCIATRHLRDITDAESNYILV